jgi:SAM-dependent methyltransferase
VNPDLFAVVPDCRRIVEVGCSRGAMALACRQRNLDCHYVGVEVDPDYAAIALQCCDLVLVGDIECLVRSTERDLLANADCWIFGDTLEHLRDPWQVLREVRSLLVAEGGRVCACIPNMQHWSIQLKLNAGSLDYEDSGLLDRTHLRWFTRKTIVRLFQAAGCRIEIFQPRIFSNPNAHRAAELVAAMARGAGFDAEEAVRDALPLQYVVRAIVD